MTGIDRTIVIRGDVQSTSDLTLYGRVEGALYAERVAVTLASTATVVGDVIARDITVFGFVDGSLIATEVVDLREGASVRGRVVSARLILNEGATFNGRVEPQHLDAAIKVARHRRGLSDPSPIGDFARPPSEAPRIVTGPHPYHPHVP